MFDLIHCKRGGLHLHKQATCLFAEMVVCVLHNYDNQAIVKTIEATCL